MGSSPINGPVCEAGLFFSQGTLAVAVRPSCFARAPQLAIAYPPSSSSVSFRCKDVRHAIYNDAELENAFDGFAAEASSGVIVAQAPATATRDNRQLILLLATRHLLPVIHRDHAYPRAADVL